MTCFSCLNAPLINLQKKKKHQYLNSCTLQIVAALTAIRYTSDLTWPGGHKINDDEDMLDWLKTMFRFQVIIN